MTDWEILQQGVTIIAIAAGAIAALLWGAKQAVDIWATLKDVQLKLEQLAPKTKTPVDDIVAEVLKQVLVIFNKSETPPTADK